MNRSFTAAGVAIFLIAFIAAVSVMSSNDNAGDTLASTGVYGGDNGDTGGNGGSVPASSSSSSSSSAPPSSSSAASSSSRGCVNFFWGCTDNCAAGFECNGACSACVPSGDTGGSSGGGASSSAASGDGDDGGTGGTPGGTDGGDVGGIGDDGSIGGIIGGDDGGGGSSASNASDDGGGGGSSTSASSDDGGGSSASASSGESSEGFPYGYCGRNEEGQCGGVCPPGFLCGRPDIEGTVPDACLCYRTAGPCPDPAFPDHCFGHCGEVPNQLCMWEGIRGEGGGCVCVEGTGESAGGGSSSYDTHPDCEVIFDCNRDGYYPECYFDLDLCECVGVCTSPDP